jgi:Peptidase family M23
MILGILFRSLNSKLLYLLGATLFLISVFAVQTALANTLEEKLSILVMGGVHRVSNGYQPNKIHAGIDFADTGMDVTSIKSPVTGTIVANTSACGKVAIFDGINTIILAHMSNRTTIEIGKPISMGDYVGKAAKVLGGGCSADGPHLHIEVRTGNNLAMAKPSSDNSKTTIDPSNYLVGSPDAEPPGNEDELLDFSDSQIVSFLNDYNLKMVCNPTPNFTEMPSRNDGIREEKILPLFEYASNRCRTGKQNPLLLLVTIAITGNIELGDVKKGTLPEQTKLVSDLIEIFAQRKRNRVYRESTNQIETSITVKVPRKIQKKLFLMTLDLVIASGSDSIYVYVDR